MFQIENKQLYKKNYMVKMAIYLLLSLNRRTLEMVRKSISQQHWYVLPGYNL